MKKFQQMQTSKLLVSILTKTLAGIEKLKNLPLPAKKDSHAISSLRQHLDMLILG